MDPNFSITASVPSSLGATRSNKHSRQDHLGDMKSERTHTRMQVSASYVIPNACQTGHSMGLSLGLIVKYKLINSSHANRGNCYANHEPCTLSEILNVYTKRMSYCI